MPAPFGITTTGFSRKTLEEVKADLEASLLADVSPNLDLSASSVHGQVLGVFADRLAELWDLAAAVYASQYPDGASGFSLVQLAALTGTLQELATPSRVTETVNLNGGTTLPAGSVVAVSGNETVRFKTLVAVVAPAGPAANYSVAMECEVTGPSVANAGTLTVIKTPVAGWNSATNALDAVLGTDVESDPALRARREDELRAQGTSPLDAVRSDLLQVANVTQVRVYENTTHFPDADGVPAHAVEAVVLGGTDAAVAAALFAAKAAGIHTHGSTSVVVVDSAGNSHTVKFSRPTTVNTWVAVTVLTDPNTFPSDGATQIKNAIVALSGDEEIGEDVVRTAYYAPVFSVSGVVDVTVLKVDDVDPPVSTGNLDIASRQIADLDTSRIAVTVT